MIVPRLFINNSLSLGVDAPLQRRYQDEFRKEHGRSKWGGSLRVSSRLRRIHPQWNVSGAVLVEAKGMVMIRFDEVVSDAKSQQLFVNWSVELLISNLKKGVSSLVIVAESAHRSEAGFTDSFLWSSGLLSFFQKRFSEESADAVISSNLSSVLVRNGIFHVIYRVEAPAWISSPPLIYPLKLLKMKVI